MVTQPGVHKQIQNLKQITTLYSIVIATVGYYCSVTFILMVTLVIKIPSTDSRTQLVHDLQV